MPIDEIGEPIDPDVRILDPLSFAEWFAGRMKPPQPRGADREQRRYDRRRVACAEAKRLIDDAIAAARTVDKPADDKDAEWIGMAEKTIARHPDWPATVGWAKTPAVQTIARRLAKERPDLRRRSMPRLMPASRRRPHERGHGRHPQRRGRGYQDQL